MDLKVILQVKTCSKGPNSRQGIPPVVNLFMAGNVPKKAPNYVFAHQLFFTSSSWQDTTEGGCISQYSYSVILDIVCMYMNRFINM